MENSLGKFPETAGVCQILLTCKRNYQEKVPTKLILSKICYEINGDIWKLQIIEKQVYIAFLKACKPSRM